MAMKVWMRPDWAGRMASPARRCRFRARPGTDGGLLTAWAMAWMASKSPGGGGKAGLDDIHPHLFELAGDPNLLFPGHRGAGALFAVAQGGVENDQGCFMVFSGRMFPAATAVGEKDLPQSGGGAKPWAVRRGRRPAPGRRRWGRLMQGLGQPRMVAT